MRKKEGTIYILTDISVKWNMLSISDFIISIFLFFLKNIIHIYDLCCNILLNLLNGTIQELLRLFYCRTRHMFIQSLSKELRFIR